MQDPNLLYNVFRLLQRSHDDRRVVSRNQRAEADVASIRKAFFCISNLQGVGSIFASGKPIQVLNFAEHPLDLSYFSFRSVVSSTNFDSYAPDKVLYLGFSLRLPQIIYSSLDFATTTEIDLPLGITPSKPMEGLSFKMDYSFDNIISQIGEDEVRALLVDVHNVLLQVVPTLVRYFSRLTSFLFPMSLT